MEFLEPGISDHSPALLTFGSRKSFGPKSFRFCNLWCEHADFKNWIEVAWNSEVRGTPMYKLRQKLKATQLKLKVFNKDLYTRLSQRVQLIRERLEAVQIGLLQNSNDTRLIELEKQLLRENLSISRARKSLMKQILRNKWLNSGDHESSYFHIIVKGRQGRNEIKCLLDHDGGGTRFY